MPDTQVIVERLRSDDIGELLTVQRAAFLRDAQLYADPFLPSLTQTVGDLEHEVALAANVFIVAKIGTRLVGSARAHVSRRVSGISRIMTAPDLEGRGIGGQLLAAIEDATRADVDLFELSTGAGSSSNIAMYERRGYRIVRESTDSRGHSIVTMQKAVRPVTEEG